MPWQVVKVVTDLNADVDILKDVDIFNAARRDDDGTEVQAFVAESLGQVSCFMRCKFCHLKFLNSVSTGCRCCSCAS